MAFEVAGAVIADPVGLADGRLDDLGAALGRVGVVQAVIPGTPSRPRRTWHVRCKPAKPIGLTPSKSTQPDAAREPPDQLACVFRYVYGST